MPDFIDHDFSITLSFDVNMGQGNMPRIEKLQEESTKWKMRMNQPEVLDNSKQMIKICFFILVNSFIFSSFPYLFP